MVFSFSTLYKGWVEYNTLYIFIDVIAIIINIPSPFPSNIIPFCIGIYVHNNKLIVKAIVFLYPPFKGGGYYWS